MPFGRYRGLPLNAIPSDYLAWLLSLDDLRQPLRGCVWREAVRRGLARDDEDDDGSRYVPPPRSQPVDLELAERLITAGYRALAKQLHPDVGSNTETMQKVNAAAEALRAQFRVVRRAS